ncbi:glycerol-3-phosphate 1-O-acyltransferase PlsY [Clostridium ganghwense]|uniref:Glycerol-3-phosphate acyltransferase n=1 Tax=Clostridium ganghwense TaxID=312089 RepID=A0ABT4CU38_9CLOT|nr:glycerol-3-phosphate 1-O-acyltransferase PlsY [Clostridium ganghwense]MCY6372572.1 glycerol-3-phosphate 1-O-acyltransferase PlsY [Clostridium ganghwense]
MDYLILALTILFSYLCGSIPSGYFIVKRLCGIDIRTKGSGNIGSTNVRRIAGNKISTITQIIDILKGIIPITIGINIASTVNLPVSTDVYLSLIAMSAILGHNYTIFLGFKGGKGVNTTVGTFLILAPVPTLLAVIIHFVLRLFTDIVSIRSIALGVVIPIACVVMKFSLPIIVASTIAAILMIIRHKDNIIRLFKNEEK